MATAGDVNGDGFADVIVGAHRYDNGQTDEGRAFVYHGSAAGLSLTASWTAESDQANAQFGYSVATAGDVNGDGYSRRHRRRVLLRQRPDRRGPGLRLPRLGGGLERHRRWTAESDQASAYFGCSVATAGDVNGDGFADVIVGAYLYDNGQTDEGRAFVYHGSASGLADRRLDRGERPGERRLRLLGGDGGGRQRRRLRRRHRRRVQLTTTARRTRAGRSSTTARRAGSASTPAGRRRATRRAPASAGRWRRRGT